MSDVSCPLDAVDGGQPIQDALVLPSRWMKAATLSIIMRSGTPLDNSRRPQGTKRVRFGEYYKKAIRDFILLNNKSARHWNDIDEFLEYYLSWIELPTKKGKFKDVIRKTRYRMEWDRNRRWRTLFGKYVQTAYKDWVRRRIQIRDREKEVPLDAERLEDSKKSDFDVTNRVNASNRWRQSIGDAFVYFTDHARQTGPLTLRSMETLRLYLQENIEISTLADKCGINRRTVHRHVHTSCKFIEQHLQKNIDSSKENLRHLRQLCDTLARHQSDMSRKSARAILVRLLAKNKLITTPAEIMSSEP